MLKFVIAGEYYYRLNYFWDLGVLALCNGPVLSLSSVFESAIVYRQPLLHEFSGYIWSQFTVPVTD